MCLPLLLAFSLMFSSEIMRQLWTFPSECSTLEMLLPPPPQFPPLFSCFQKASSRGGSRWECSDTSVSGNAMGAAADAFFKSLNQIPSFKNARFKKSPPSLSLSGMSPFFLSHSFLPLPTTATVPRGACHWAQRGMEGERDILLDLGT